MSAVMEVTVISAEGLTAKGRPIKDKAFAILRGDHDGADSSASVSYTTGIDEDGGQSPSWNEKLTVSLPMSSRALVVEVRRGGLSRDEIIGTARILKSDFMGVCSVPMLNHLHFLSYRLRDSRGIRNGIINVSVRVTSSCLSQVGIGIPAECTWSAHEGVRRTVIGYPAQHDGIRKRTRD